MASWTPPRENECPQTNICKEKHECQDLCKARENLIEWIKDEILGYHEGENDGNEHCEDVPPPLF